MCGQRAVNPLPGLLMTSIPRVSLALAGDGDDDGGGAYCLKIDDQPVRFHLLVFSISVLKSLPVI